METLKLGATLTTRGPRVLLDPALKVGLYRVELVVQGGSGKSAPAILVIRVLKE